MSLALPTDRRGSRRATADGRLPPTVTVLDTCTACGACLSTCPTRALRAAPRRPVVLDVRCIGCMACVEICPRGALEEVPR